MPIWNCAHTLIANNLYLSLMSIYLCIVAWYYLSSANFMCLLAVPALWLCLPSSNFMLALFDCYTLWPECLWLCMLPAIWCWLSVYCALTNCYLLTAMTVNLTCCCTDTLPDWLWVSILLFADPVLLLMCLPSLNSVPLCWLFLLVLTVLWNLTAACSYIACSPALHAAAACMLDLDAMLLPALTVACSDFSLWLIDLLFCIWLCCCLCSMPASAADPWWTPVSLCDCSVGWCSCYAFLVNDDHAADVHL